jgi:CDP-diacylglycerol--glycerol-3-phosphate 3-phosphatidyltransferase/cardiolipin synthase
MIFNVPNTLTWARILMIPLIVGVFYAPHDWLTPFEQNVVATVIFIAAAVTDWFDGYLARVLGQTSAFGAFLDPVADKLMVAAALLILMQLGRLDALLAIIIIGREITISALREWMAHMGAARSVAVSLIGKVKTTAQMVAIPMLLFHGSLLGLDMQRVGTWLIWLAALLTLWSMGYYMRMAWPELSSGDRAPESQSPQAGEAQRRSGG